MKKSLFYLIVATLALVSFNKKDDSTITDKSADLKVKDWFSNNVKEYSFERNTDTTKKGGGRGNYTPYRSAGNGGKEGHGRGKVGKATSDPGTGGDGKKEAVIFRQQKNK